MSPGRTLPLRVPIMAGEALDSWLEALARRSRVTVGTLTAALGWPVPATPGGLVAGIAAQVLRRLEHLAGLPARRLDVAVLDRYLPLGPVRRRPPTGSATAPAPPRQPSRTARPDCSPPAPGRSRSCYGPSGRSG